MTPAEFAVAVGADPKWIRNARRTLGRSMPTGSGAAEAFWLGLVHDLHGSLGIGLVEGGRIVDAALAADARLQPIGVASNDAGTVAITIDLARARSLHALRCAHALYVPAVDRRGRPATGYRPVVEAVKRRARRNTDVRTLCLNARRSPADRFAALGPFADILRGLSHSGVRFAVIGEVAAALFGAMRRPATVDVIHDRTDAGSLHVLAMFLNDCRATPRGAPQGEPHILDARLLGAAGTLALDTPHGALNLFVQLDPIGGYAAVLEHADEECGVPVLGLPAQMMLQRLGGRTPNAELLFELQVLERERRREAARLSRRLSWLARS